MGPHGRLIPFAAPQVRRRSMDAPLPFGPCPICGGVLATGSAEVHGNPLDALRVGRSSQQLWFSRLDAVGGDEILANSERVAALQCESCRAVIIPKDKPIPAPNDSQATDWNDFVREQRDAKS